MALLGYELACRSLEILTEPAVIQVAEGLGDSGQSPDMNHLVGLRD